MTWQTQDSTARTNFGNESDFESRLTARTRVPAERLSQFMAWPHERVHRESQTVARVLKRFAEAVVSSMENPASGDEFLRSLDLKSISRDHDWRAIFATIRTDEATTTSYKRTVLIKYLQYLSFRKRLLEYILSRKQGLEETDGYSDMTHLRGDAAPGEEFERVPTGETVALDLHASGGRIDVMLAAHLFRIIGGSPSSIIDQNGVTYFLKPGRNMIGRHPESDVVVDQNFHDVSRAHVVVDLDDEGGVRVTDLSTRGTSLRREALAHAVRFMTS